MSTSAALQKGVLEALKAAGIVGGRIYDSIPPEPVFPYISFGPSDVSEDGADCIESGEHTLQIDVWSRAVGRVEAKNLTDTVKRALHEETLTLEAGFLVEMRADFRQVIGDPDGATSHGIVRLTATIEEDE